MAGMTLSLAWACVASGQRLPDPPAAAWKDFVNSPGHSDPIPVQWVATPEGRFAHSIRLPDSIPKPVPFDFAKAQLKAVVPSSPSVARQYWEHLCATEAGSFILKSVDNVDGFAFLRAVGGMNEQELRDRWKKEAPKLQSDYGWRYDPLVEAVGYVNPPHATYLYVEYPDPQALGGFLKLSGFVDGKTKFSIEQIPSPTSRYAVAWRGVHRPKDREHLVAGYEWIVIDRTSSDVLAVFRDFAITGFARKEPDGIYWLNAERCDFRKKIFGSIRPGIPEASSWIPRVLKPAAYPSQLEFIDKQVGGAR